MTRAFGKPGFERAARHAAFYRSLGLNPVPSRTDIKGPALRSGDVARYRDGEPIPEKWIESWWSGNLQLACGVPWRLMVVDLDGALAAIQWRRWARSSGVPRTWTVRTGGGGLHLYFRLPPWLPACKTRKVWGVWDAAAKNWARHQWIEILGDKSLVIAPPSVHVDTRRPYRFMVGPREVSRPAPCPSWVLRLPEIGRPQPPPPRQCRAPHSRAPARRTGRNHDWRDVLGRLPPGRKVELAGDWGLRFAAGRENAAGWMSCHAIDRDDRHPSASFHPESGFYWTNAGCLGFFELAAALEAYPTWIDACNALGDMTT